MLHHNEWNRLENTTVITGLGRSGTTFLAMVFYNAGYDMGITPRTIGRNIPDGGMEIHNINSILEHGLPKKQYPRVTKDPTFARRLDIWEDFGQRPRDVIFLCRDADSCLKSHRYRNHNTNKCSIVNNWYKGLRNIIIRGIPYIVVPYPEIGTNPKLSELLKPWIDDPWDIIQGTFNEQKVHF